MRDIPTWFKCIKRQSKNKTLRTSPFVKANDCDYSYESLYLGAKGTAKFHSQNLFLQMSYSVRDGILINIKNNKPYKVLFDYIDGRYLINDYNDEEYKSLVESLVVLNEKTEKQDYVQFYDELEKIVYDFAMRVYRL